MPSTCPKCHRTVAEDLICCADRQYTWRCKACRKVTTSFALPYGKCYMCGGLVEIVEGYAFEDPMQIEVIRDAVQFELNTFHFYRMALARTTDPTLRVVFEILLQNEKEHLHTLQERYHTHLNDDILSLRPEPEKLMAEEVFSGIDLSDATGGAGGLYDKAIEMERRTRNHFHAKAAALPDCPERDLCLELAAEEDEHVALLEMEREYYLSRQAHA